MQTFYFNRKVSTFFINFLWIFAQCIFGEDEFENFAYTCGNGKIALLSKEYLTLFLLLRLNH